MSHAHAYYFFDNPEENIIINQVHLAVCDECGNIYQHDDNTLHCGLCSPACAKSAGLAPCRHCGRWYSGWKDTGASYCHVCSQFLAEREQQLLLCSSCKEVILLADQAVAEFYCSSACAEDAGLMQCRHCQEWLDDETATPVPDGYACDSCVSRLYSRCEHCGTLVPDSYIQHVDDIDLCDECFCESYTQCEVCHEEVYIDYVRYIEPQEIDICNRCYRRDYYVNCPQCGKDVHQDHYNSMFQACRACEPNCDVTIYSWSYKPIPIKHYTDGNLQQHRLYFGIENEMEVPHSISKALDTISLPTAFADNLFYFKQDGTIARGFEIVSHPGTLRFWESIRDDMESIFRKLHEQGCTCDSNGLHVHITKAGMSLPHRRRFQAFFDACEHLETIARRPANEYCKYKKIAGRQQDGSYESWEYSVYNNSRYMAVNWHPADTVEIRIFCGTLSIQEFYAAIQFCHAVYQFTKGTTVNGKPSTLCSLATIKHGLSWPLFCKYIEFNKRYSDLICFLKNNNIFTPELRKCA